jgi:hypothetical protein
MVLLFFTYLACCGLVGYLARDRIIGFVGFFLLSLIFTPFIMFLVFLLGMRRGTGS